MSFTGLGRGGSQKGLVPANEAGFERTGTHSHVFFNRHHQVVGSSVDLTEQNPFGQHFWPLLLDVIAQTLQIIGVGLSSDGLDDLGITHQQQSFKIPENGRYDFYCWWCHLCLQWGGWGWVLPSFWLFFCFKVGVMNLVLVHDYESFQKVIWMSFKKFQIMIWRVRICSWLKTLKRRATQRVDTFLEPSSIVRMLLARSCEVPNLSSIWRVGSRRSSITISRTRSMFSSVGAVEAFRTLASSSTPSLPCLNLLTQHLPVA